jgi:hypothetical protein
MKCWCGKELVSKGVGDFRDNEALHMECPEHGLEYLWRPCELTGRSGWWRG